MCLKSKAVGVIILWCLFAFISFHLCSRAYVFLTTDLLPIPMSQAIFYGFFPFHYLLYPFGGLMGDIVCGRYRMIKGSLMFLLVMYIMLIISGFLFLVLVSSHHINNALRIFMEVHGCLLLTGVVGLVPFFANVLPFAMDQLRDAPVEELITFIYWYVWTLYASQSLRSILINGLFNAISYKCGASCLITISGLILVILLASMVVTGRRPEWFNNEGSRVNPYKLVYKATKFAFKHKYPVQRSAFTYCEDEIPSRLDLGKRKYGGPFTTEQVEDVKVFYQILKVLFCLAPFMYLFEEVGTVFTDLQIIATNFEIYRRFSDIEVLPDTLIALAIPVYLCIRHRLFHRFPTFCSLRKIEMGMVLVLLKLVFMLSVGIAVHVRRETLGCMFQGNSDHTVFSPSIVVVILLVQNILTVSSTIILYTSFIEFICAQSPHTMKGMLVGLAYAFLGLFKALGGIVIPFQYWVYPAVDCGLIYYSINVVIGVISFTVFVSVAKQYKYRERDEPSRVRQYAEEYYSKEQIFNCSISYS